MKIVKIFLPILFIAVSFCIVAQENAPTFQNDSVQVLPPRIMGYSVDALQIRTAAGWVGRPTIELGLQRSGYAVGCVGIGGINYYASSGFSYDFNASNEVNNPLVVNPKIGADLMFLMFSFGGQLNYYTNFEEHAFGFSPVLSFWLGNQWKIQYIENFTWGNDNPALPNIGSRGVMVVYGINLKKRDSREQYGF